MCKERKLLLKRCTEEKEENIKKKEVTLNLTSAIPENNNINRNKEKVFQVHNKERLDNRIII